MSHVFVSRDTKSPLGKVTWLREMLCTYKVMLSENSGKSRVIHKVHVADDLLVNSTLLLSVFDVEDTCSDYFGTTYSTFSPREHKP